MTEYAAIAGLVTIGIIIGILIGRASKKSVYNYTVPREPVDSLIRNSRPVSPATKMRQIIDAMELERRSPPEPPTMAELAREQSDRVRNEWVDERLPDLLDSVMKAVYEASSDGGKCVVFYTGHNRNDVDLIRNKHKEVALAQATKERLQAGAFHVDLRAASHKADEDGFGLLISW